MQMPLPASGSLRVAVPVGEATAARTEQVRRHFEETVQVVRETMFSEKVRLASIGIVAWHRVSKNPTGSGRHGRSASWGHLASAQHPSAHTKSPASRATDSQDGRIIPGDDANSGPVSPGLGDAAQASCLDLCCSSSQHAGQTGRGLRDAWRTDSEAVATVCVGACQREHVWVGASKSPRGGPTAPYSLWSPASSMVGGSRAGVPTRAPAVVSNYSLRLRPASSLVGPVPVCPREHLRSSPTTATTCELTGWSRPGVPTRAPAVVSNYSLRLRPASSLVGPVPVCPREHLRSSPTTATPSTCELTGWSRPGVPTRAPAVVSNYSLRLRPASSLVGPVPVCPREHLRSSPTTAYAFDLRAHWLVPSRCAHASTCGRLQLQPTPSTCELTGWSRPGVPTRAPAVVSNYSLRLRPASSLVGPVPVCPREHLRSSPTTAYAFDLRAHWLVPSRCAHASTCGRLQLQPTPSTCELTGWSRPGVPTRAPAVVSNYSLRLRPASSLVGPVPVCPREHLRSSPTTAYAFDLRAHWLVPSRCAHASTCGRLQLQPTPSTCELTGWSRPGVPTRAPAVVSNYSLRLRPASSLVGPVPVCPREHLRSSPTTAYAFDLRAHWLVPSRCAHASTCGRLQLQPAFTCELTGWSRPGVPTRAPAVVSNYSLRLRPASSLVGPVPVCPREHLRSSPTTAYAFDLRAHWLVPSRCAHASTCGRLQLQPTPSTCELTGWSRPGVPMRAPAVVSNYSLRLRPASSLVGPVPVCPREHLRSSPTTAYAFDLRAHWLAPSRCAHSSTCGRLQLQPIPATSELIAWSRPGVPMRAPAVVSSYSGSLRAHLFVFFETRHVFFETWYVFFETRRVFFKSRHVFFESRHVFFETRPVDDGHGQSPGAVSRGGTDVTTESPRKMGSEHAAAIQTLEERLRELERMLKESESKYDRLQQHLEQVEDSNEDDKDRHAKEMLHRDRQIEELQGRNASLEARLVRSAAGVAAPHRAPVFGGGRAGGAPPSRGRDEPEEERDMVHKEGLPFGSDDSNMDGMSEDPLSQNHEESLAADSISERFSPVVSGAAPAILSGGRFSEASGDYDDMPAVSAVKQRLYTSSKRPSATQPITPRGPLAKMPSVGGESQSSSRSGPTQKPAASKAGTFGTSGTGSRIPAREQREQKTPPRGRN
ncbi:unnamed protein product [Polarella glacialis]|uniref:Uncharacterized protein n=1 Tax=Polarella glacialis TaxID=89957 RepID=A0A813FDD5_POLGL|nr:unnamed protein product [Polarella glacialis]